MAISADGERWFLINASPDIRVQFEAFPSLHPQLNAGRNSPLEGIFLTNADLDHTAGLLLLREGGPLNLYASSLVREYLSKQLPFTSLLNSFCGIIWHDLSDHGWLPLRLTNGELSSLSYRALPLQSPPPVFSHANDSEEKQTMAFQFRDEKSGGLLLVAPDVFEVSEELNSALNDSDAVLFDGTFWSEDELGTVKTTDRKSSDMGHLPVKTGSLDLLSRSPAQRRIYLHINNTNPMLMPGSAERQLVESAGITVGWDGIEFEL